MDRKKISGSLDRLVGRASGLSLDRSETCPTLGFLILVVLLTACGSGKSPVIVGGKNFTEQDIVGEIVAQQVEKRLQAPVERRFGLGGTGIAQDSLLSRNLDVYPEYTGTALTNVLKLPPEKDPKIVLDKLRKAYATWKLEWMNPLGFSNTFAMVVRGEDAKIRKLEKLTDAVNDTKGFRLGAGYEFLQRADGYQLLNGAYSITWNSGPKSMDLGLLYEALKQWQVDMVASSSTDGMLSVLDVKVLKDDKHIFPPYEACLVVRSEAFTEHPGLREALADLSGKITEDAMRKMNYQVDGKHRPASEVAREWLEANK